jgi:ATP-dependent Clp protease adaptor protein ClpS
MSTHQAAEADVAVAEPEAPVVKPKKKAKSDPKKKPPRKQPRYHVILWNDDDHSYEYVVEMMQKLFGHPKEKGFLIAKEVDSQGKAICFTTALEHAELKRDQIHAYGPDKGITRCKGSMSATIEADAS